MTGPFDFAAPVPGWATLGPVHLVAVGGIGMSAVARLLAARGVRVSGSDAVDSPLLAALAAEGVRVHVGHDPAHLADARTVVVSSAVRPTNVELTQARRRGLRVLHRAQALAAAMGSARRVAVAGANGKTTTTSLMVAALAAAGLDPSYAIGGELVSTGTNAHLGSPDLFVVEADESDGSFVVYHPDVAVVTSVQPDHLDHFGTFAAVVAAYRQFVESIRPGGLLVVCVDDSGAAQLGHWARGRGVRVLGYGLAEGADARVREVALTGSRARAVVDWAGRRIPLSLRIPGDYNLLNATAVLVAANAGLGAPIEDVVAGLGAFAGTRRRFEQVGEAGGVRVVDDYAHNPAKVAAVVSTGRRLSGGGRLVVLFQPHLYSRTRDFAAEFGAALSPADAVVVMDVYAAREDPIPGVDAAMVVSAVRAARPECLVSVAPERSGLVAALADLVLPGDLVLTVGAGDVTQVGPALVDLLRQRQAGR
ncbi:MAG: UDP-N-acetylmuramate--L-alanine ligase [Dermatophilaceae bacterium]